MRRTPILLACAGLLSLYSIGMSLADTKCSPQLMDSRAPFALDFQKACHNCYEKQYAKTFISLFDSVNIVELDFWDDKDCCSQAKGHSWYVRHLPGTLFQSGNDNNCTGDGQGTNDLEACLRDVKMASDRHPGHDVYLVFLDKKQGWGPTRRPRDLDNLIREIFGSRVFQPKLLRGARPTVREAAQANAWPSADDLKDRFIFVLTGGTLTDPNGTQNEYVSEVGDDAYVFVAPNTTDKSEITGTPSSFSKTNARSVVFYNIKDGHQDVASTAFDNHYLTRLWASTEDSSSYAANLKKCVNFIALYDYKQTSFNNGLMNGTFKP